MSDSESSSSSSREVSPVDTPGYTDSDTNPNTSASSVVGEAAPQDGRKRRQEAFQMRKSMFSKKHDKLGASKVGALSNIVGLAAGSI